jgi:hypothetical protein
MKITDPARLLAISVVTALAIAFAGTSTGFLERSQVLEKSDRLPVAAKPTEPTFDVNRFWPKQ